MLFHGFNRWRKVPCRLTHYGKDQIIHFTLICVGNGAGDVLQSKGSQWVPQRHKYQRKFGLGFYLYEVVPWRHNSKQRRRPSGLPLALLRDWNIVLKLNTLGQVRCAWYTASERSGAHLSSSLGWEPNGRHKWFPQLDNPSTGREWHCWKGLAEKTQ